MPGNDERVAGGFASENKPFAVDDVRGPPLVQRRKCVLPVVCGTPLMEQTCLVEFLC